MRALDIAIHVVSVLNETMYNENPQIKAPSSKALCPNNAHNGDVVDGLFKIRPLGSTSGTCHSEWVN